MKKETMNITESKEEHTEQFRGGKGRNDISKRKEKLKIINRKE